MTAPVYLAKGVEIPASTPFAVEVPKKGASCATCRFLVGGARCGNAFYVANSGMGSALGRKPKRWCCSMWAEGS